MSEIHPGQRMIPLLQYLKDNDIPMPSFVPTGKLEDLNRVFVVDPGKPRVDCVIAHVSNQPYYMEAMRIANEPVEPFLYQEDICKFISKRVEPLSKDFIANLSVSSSSRMGPAVTLPKYPEPAMVTPFERELFPMIKSFYISHASARHLGVDKLIQDTIGVDLWNYLSDEGRMISYPEGGVIDQAVKAARGDVVKL